MTAINSKPVFRPSAPRPPPAHRAPGRRGRPARGQPPARRAAESRRSHAGGSAAEARTGAEGRRGQAPMRRGNQGPGSATRPRRVGAGQDGPRTARRPGDAGKARAAGPGRSFGFRSAGARNAPSDRARLPALLFHGHRPLRRYPRRSCGATSARPVRASLLPAMAPNTDERLISASDSPDFPVAFRPPHTIASAEVPEALRAACPHSVAAAQNNPCKSRQLCVTVMFILVVSRELNVNSSRFRRDRSAIGPNRGS